MLSFEQCGFGHQCVYPFSSGFDAAWTSIFSIRFVVLQYYHRGYGYANK
jgi:hypothetical protein